MRNRENAPPYDNLLDAEHLAGRLSTRTNTHFADLLQRHAGAMAKENIFMPPLAVLLQARERPYPRFVARDRGWNDIFHQILYTLGGVRRQQYTGPCEAVVMIDAGHQITAKQDLALSKLAEPELEGHLPINVRLLEVDRAKTHAEALNIGRQKVLNPAEDRPRPEVIALTEKGARYATDQAFRTQAWGINQGAEGVYGTRLADGTASLPESLLYGVSAHSFVKLTRPDETPKRTFGFMAGDRAAFEAHFLREHPFDETFQRGGSDGQVAAKADVLYHPAASIQMAENLGPIALTFQVWEWSKYGGPTTYPAVS